MKGAVLDSKRSIALAWAPAAAYMALIWVLSSISTLPVVQHLPFQDKVAHFVEYTVLGLLYSHALARSSAKRGGLLLFAAASALAVLWGASDELHQYFVPGRDCSILDWAADGVGAVVGALLYQQFTASRRRLPSRSG